MLNNNSERFVRLRMLVEDEGMERLSEATVMVIGLGGVGSSCAEALARGGVGNLILIDGDNIEMSNINRQALAFTSTVGRVKAEVMKEMVYEINPDCQVQSQQVFIDPSNIDTILSSYPKPDYVMDCIDSVMSKLALIEWCGRQDIPLLVAMGAGNKLDPTYLKFDYIENTFNCYLSKVIRIECRKRGIKNLEVIFSTQTAFNRQKGKEGEKIKTLGTMSYLPPIMGQMLAGKALRRIAGLEPFGKKLKIIAR